MIEFTKDNNEVSVKEVVTSALELCIDTEHVSVPLHRYEELVRSETELEILLRAYQQQSNYQLEYVLQAVFGSRNPDEPTKDDGNA